MREQEFVSLTMIFEGFNYSAPPIFFQSITFRHGRIGMEKLDSLLGRKGSRCRSNMSLGFYDEGDELRIDAIHISIFF